jgi:hypothetical protein
MQVNKSGYKITERRYATSGNGFKKRVPLMVTIHWARKIFKMVLLAESIFG